MTPFAIFMTCHQG